MATTKVTEAQKEEVTVENSANSQKKQLQAILAKRLQAAQDSKAMTPKMQRSVDRFATNIANIEKEK